MDSKTNIFSVGNKHILVADSGEPPHIDGNSEGRYHGYFENEYGEQAVFVYDYQARMGTLWMGDAGWDNIIAVMDGDAPDTVLGETEAIWLRACWLAATASLSS